MRLIVNGFDLGTTKELKVELRVDPGGETIGDVVIDFHGGPLLCDQLVMRGHDAAPFLTIGGPQYEGPYVVGAEVTIDRPAVV